MIKVSEILEKVTNIYNDLDYERFDKTTYLKYISDALNQVLLMRPDANAKTITLDLIKGVKQSLPDDGFRLIDILYNVNADGSPSSAITMVPKAALDTISSMWPTTTGMTTVYNFAHDPTNPKEFWVMPGVADGTKVEIVYSQSFPEVLADTDVVDVDEIFKDAIVAGVMIYLYSSETESDISVNKMQLYVQMLTALVQTEQQQGMSIGPREDK